MASTRLEVRKFTKAEYFDALESCGWLGNLDATEREDLIARITKAYGDGHPLAKDGFRLSALDLAQHLSVLWIDAEMSDEDGPYKALLGELAKVSKGTFKPTKITDTLDPDGIATISFQLGARTFSVEIKVHRDWLDIDVFDDLINEALRATGVERRFRVLPSSDQTVSLAFVPDAVWRKAIELGVITGDRVAPLRERKPCSEEQLAARLPPGEGVPGLHEWCGQLRGAIVDEVRAAGRARITIGLGTIGVRPGRAPGEYKLDFHAAEAFRDIINGETAELDDADDVVTAIAVLLREGYDEFVLHGIGRLRLRSMPAYDTNFLDRDVAVGAKNMLVMQFDRDLPLAFTDAPKAKTAAKKPAPKKTAATKPAAKKRATR